MKFFTALALVLATAPCLLAAPTPSQKAIRPRDSEDDTTEDLTIEDLQYFYALAIMEEARDAGVGRHGCEAAIATALVESTLIMYANMDVPPSLTYPHDRLGTDGDSIGLFQHRASLYEDIACDMDPRCSAGLFFDDMLAIDDWEGLPVGELSQAVQRSQIPGAYAERVEEASGICAEGGF